MNVILQEVGLRDYRCGDAQFSPKHANFIVNRGRATASQVRKLIELAQERVYQSFGILLEPEIAVAGEP